MSTLLAMRWRITALMAPQPHLNCSRCGRFTAYRHTGKFRLNAQARRVDAWLIYRCTVCDTVWNRPLIERRNVRDVDATLLGALHANDFATAERFARDVRPLQKMARRIDYPGTVSTHKEVIRATRADRPCPDITGLEVTFAVPMVLPVRIDRLLSQELAISRSRLRALEKAGRLRLPDDRRKALRQPVHDGLRVTLDCGNLTDGKAMIQAAREVRCRSSGTTVPDDWPD